MMELYKREKVNPLAGCLPMVIQIPVFLAFYWVLRDSVEMRQAPFIFWISDLSARDPYFVLPAIMAAAMFVQYKLNPQVGDPAQQKMMMFMPLAMSVTFAFFPAGLVLYWVTNTVLSILQQWNINRRIEDSREPRQACERSRHHRRGRHAARAWRHRDRAPLRSRRAGASPRPARHVAAAAACRAMRSSWMPQGARSTTAWRCTFRRRTPIPASTCSSCTATAARCWSRR